MTIAVRIWACAAALVVSTVLADTSRGQTDSPGLALERLATAHTRARDYAVTSRVVAVHLEPSMVALLQQRPGWWGVTESYMDRVNDRTYPVVGLNRYACGPGGAVAVTSRRLVGSPSDQATPLRQLVSPTIWVEQHPISGESATFIRYTPRTAEEDRLLRKAGRVPHADVLGALTYSTLVRAVHARLLAAPDLSAVADGSSTVVASERFGATAWVAADGALEAAELQTHNAERRRYVFSGTVVDDYFPARFPAELRVYGNRAGSAAAPMFELLTLEVFDAPQPPTDEDRANLDPERLGIRLVERKAHVATAGVASGTLPSGGIWRAPARPWVLALLAGAAIYVAIVKLRRHQSRRAR